MSASMTFEQYLAKHESETRPSQREPDRTRCGGCLAKRKLLTSDGHCEPCLRYMYGYDQAEANIATEIIRGAITGALEAEVSTEIIALAVHRAMEDYQTGMADEWIEGCRKAERARA